MTTTEDVGIKELQSKIDAWHLVRREIDKLEDQKSEFTKSRLQLEAQISEIMVQLDLKSFKGNEGSIQLREVQYVNMPETDQQRTELFDHLRETEQFDALATVHYQRLNSWFKSKTEENGGLPPIIPGLDAPKIRYELRKGK